MAALRQQLKFNQWWLLNHKKQNKKSTSAEKNCGPATSLTLNPSMFAKQHCEERQTFHWRARFAKKLSPSVTAALNEGFAWEVTFSVAGPHFFSKPHFSQHWSTSHTNKTQPTKPRGEQKEHNTYCVRCACYTGGPCLIFALHFTHMMWINKSLCFNNLNIRTQILMLFNTALLTYINSVCENRTSKLKRAPAVIPSAIMLSRSSQ